MNMQEEVRGRNTFAFWMIFILLFTLASINLILTLSIPSVLRMRKSMENLEIVPEANCIKCYGETYFDKILKKDGLIEGFSDVPISITGDNSDARVNIVKGNNGVVRNNVLMTKNGTTFSGVNLFEIKNPQTNENIFSTHKPHYNIPNGVDNLVANSLSVSRLISPIDESLNLNSTRGRITLRGTEGVSMEAREIHLSSDLNLNVKSQNGSIYLNVGAGGGVYVDMRKIPIVGGDGIKIEQEQFKVCVCMPQGKLFKVPITPKTHNNIAGICSHFSIKHDPCL